MLTIVISVSAAVVLILIIALIITCVVRHRKKDETAVDSGKSPEHIIYTIEKPVKTPVP